MNSLKLDKGFGMIGDLLKNALLIADQTGYRVKFDFNGVEVSVTNRTFNKYTLGEMIESVINAVKEQKQNLDL